MENFTPSFQMFYKLDVFENSHKNTYAGLTY